MEHFSLFEVTASSKLVPVQSWYHGRDTIDSASSKDNLTQSMQHGFAIFQFNAQRYDNMDPK